MSRADFDTTKTSLEDILKEASSGKIQLPDFQRGWVWDDDGIRSLLASVSQAFPVGAVMTLQTGGDVNFRPRLIEGAEGGTEPEQLLLDGQQRITSLYQSCFSKQVISTKNTQKRAIKRWYYIDMNLALEGVDRESAIVGIPENKLKKENFGRDIVLDLSSEENEFAACHFPLNKVFDPDDWQMKFFQYWGHDSEKSKFWFEFQNDIIRNFRQYQLPIIALKKQTPKEAVCLVFEKVNTGGKKLDSFELLTAIYAADDFNLRDDWYGVEGAQGRHAKLTEFDVLETLSSTDFLQAISLLHSLEIRKNEMGQGKEGKQLSQVSGNRQSILNLPLDAYLKWADQVTEGFVKAAKFLTLQKIYWFKDVPYRTQIVPLATILSLLGDRWETDTGRSMLARWYWCGVLGELYGSAAETRFAYDVQDVPTWIDGGEVPRTINDANFTSERLYTLRSRQSAAYKGIHALLMEQGGNDFKSGQPIGITSFWDESVDIHHIFPRAWCNNIGKIPAQRHDCIINKTPIASRTNRIIGGSAPSDYLRKLEQEYKITPERLDEILSSHLIDPDMLRNDDFDAFFQAREEAIIQLIETAMGKSVARNQGDNEATGDLLDDDEDDFGN